MPNIPIVAFSKILGTKVRAANLIKIAKGRAFFEVVTNNCTLELSCLLDKTGKIKEAVLS